MIENTSGTMKGIVAKDFGDLDKVVELSEALPVPKLDTDKNPDQMLVKVHACSFSPGDDRRIRGTVTLVFKPKLPYVIGMDVCGTVVDAGKQTKFKVGDCIISSDDTFIGGCAEYSIVDARYCTLRPAQFSPEEASCLPNSCMRAMLAINGSKFKANDRVLVIGGSGGFGTFLVQLLRRKQVGKLIAVSTQEDLVMSLGADQVIDYTKQQWWDFTEFKENPFDVIFDCVGGPTSWKMAKKHKLLKTSGRFVAVAPGNPHMIIKKFFDFPGFMFPELGKMIASSFNPWSPKYQMFLADGKSHSHKMKELMKLIDDDFRVVLDPSSPFEFTTEGARAALLKEYSHHAHGKVVIKVSDIEA